MKRMKLISYVMVMVVALVLAGCGANNSKNNPTNQPPAVEPATTEAASNTDTSTGTEPDPVKIKIFQFKVEIAEQLAKLIDEYEAEHPHVTIELDTVGGGADYGAALRAKFNSNDKPDIFNNGGFTDLDLWIEHLEDLSDQPWVQNTVEVAKEPMTKDGKLYGQPLNLEGYGFIYNKDLFAQAGIDTLPTTIVELEEAAIKLQEAGITPFVNGYGEWWVLGNHFVNIPFAQQADPNTFIEGLNSGSANIADNEQFSQWVDLFDLTLKYGGRNPLQTDYNTQVTDFATGQAAMTQQGNWTQVAISAANPDINIGFLPMPINNDSGAMDKLPVGVPNNWVVHKNSEVKEEAKAFLNWLVSSETGQRYITEEFKFIPAFNNIQADEAVLGQLAADIISYSQANKTLSWNWFKFPGGEATSNEFGNVMQAYVAGQFNKEEFLKQLQAAWEKNLTN